jgi:hypothetical protein
MPKRLVRRMQATDVNQNQQLAAGPAPSCKCDCFDQDLSVALIDNRQGHCQSKCTN